MTLAKTAFLSALLCTALSGCMASQTHLGSDFGVATRQDVAAQIADPDASKKPTPAADGARVALALDRYRTGKVTPPAQAGASTIGARGDAPVPGQ